MKGNKLFEATTELLATLVDRNSTEQAIGKLKFYVDDYADRYDYETVEFAYAIRVLDAIQALLNLTDDDLSDLKGDFIDQMNSLTD